MFSEVKNKVLNLAGRRVSAQGPANGQVLRWNAAANQWEPLDPKILSSDVTDFDAAAAGVADQQIAAQKGVSNGLASLGADGKLTHAQLPQLTLTDVHVVGSEAEQIALEAQSGDVCIRTDISKTFVHNSGATASMEDWTEMLVPPDSVVSVNGQTGIILLSTNDIAEGTNNKYFTEARVKAVAVGGDVSGTVDNIKVVKLQGITITSNTPTDKQILRFNAEQNQYEIIALDIAAVEGLSAALFSKADKTALDATNAAVALKASQADLETLQGVVATKAAQTDMTQAQSDITAIQAQIGDLAGDTVASIDARVVTLETEIATKAEQADLTSLTGRVSTIEANKPDQSAVTTQITEAIAPKADKDYVDTQLGTKADKTAVQAADAALDARLTTAEGDINDLSAEQAVHGTAIDSLSSSKADKAYVDLQDQALNDRINALSGGTEGVSLSSLDSRMTSAETRLTTNEEAITEIQEDYATKVYVDQVNATQDQAISAKASQTDFDGLKSRVTNAEAAIGTAQTDITNLNVNKATVTYVDQQNSAQDQVIGIKADKTFVDSELAKKANVLDMQAALDLKANTADMNTALALKADKSQVATDIANAIADKATKDYVDSADQELSGRLDSAETRLTGVESKNGAQDGRLDAIEAAYASKTYVDNADATLNTSINGVKDRATALEGRMGTAEGKIGALETASATHALQSDLTAFETAQGIKDAAQDAAIDLKAATTYVNDQLALKADQTDFVDLSATVAGLAQAGSVDARFALVPKFTKFTLGFTDDAFKAAELRIEVPVLDLPARSKIVGITIKPSGVFTGPGFTAVSASVGPQIGGAVVEADEMFYADSIDLAGPVSDDNFIDSLEYLSKTFAAHKAALILKANQAFGDGNATLLTGGSVEVMVGYIVLP